MSIYLIDLIWLNAALLLYKLSPGRLTILFACYVALELVAHVPMEQAAAAIMMSMGSAR